MSFRKRHGDVDLIFCFRDSTTRRPHYKPTIDSRAVDLLGPGNHSMAEGSVSGEFGLVTKSEHVVSDPWLKHSTTKLRNPAL